MKISDVTVEFARDYCGVSDSNENPRIQLCMDASSAFIAGNTGLDVEDLDKHEDITVAFLTLVNEMYTNRDYTVEQAAENPLVKQIIGLHSVNYL